MRCCLSSGESGVADDVVVDAEDVLAVLLLLVAEVVVSEAELELPDADVEADDVTGVLPSLLAWTSASTNSLFSRNVLVDIPYDSNSCLIVETLMDLISCSKSVSVLKS